MILIHIIMLCFLTSCSTGWLGVADNVFDNAITVSVQEGAIKDGSNIKVSVDITQK